jgi:hypothetical protein
MDYYGAVISRLWCRNSTLGGSNTGEYPIDMCCLMTAFHSCSSSCRSFFWDGSSGRKIHPWTNFTTAVSSFVNNLLISVVACSSCFLVTSVANNHPRFREEIPLQGLTIKPTSVNEDEPSTVDLTIIVPAYN